MKHRIIVLFILAIVIFGGWWVLVRPTSQPEKKVATQGPRVVETELAPTPAADSFVVISVSGQVERKFTGQEQWEKVLEGMQLRRDDAIKTGEHSRVKLSVNDKSEIELDRLSEISVGEIAEAVHRLKLVSGKIKVDYDEDAERVLTISVKKSGAFVQTKAGRFDMQNTDQIVSVAATRGIVKLTAQEKSVAIPPRDGVQGSARSSSQSDRAFTRFRHAAGSQTSATGANCARGDCSGTNRRRGAG